MRRKALSVVLSAMLVAGALAGCGGSSSGGTQEATQAASEAASEAASTAEEVKEEVKEAAEEVKEAVSDSSGTSSELAPSDAAIAAASGKKIAYVVPSTTTPFWNWTEEGLRDICSEYGIEVQTYDSKDDSATQLSNVQNAITQGVDGIVISPTDSASVPECQNEAEAAGIPVVICDVGSDEDNYVTYISTDNYGGAKAVGEYLGKYLTDKGLSGSIGEITIPLARINGQRRTEGFAEGLGEYGFEVGTMLETSEWTLDEGDSQARNIVTANSDLIAIFANHDQAALGVVQALDDLGLGGPQAGDEEVYVCSFDGGPETVEYLRSGEELVCGAQQAKNLGIQSGKGMVMYWNGEEVPHEVMLDVLVITSDNVEENLEFIGKYVCPLD